MLMKNVALKGSLITAMILGVGGCSMMGTGADSSALVPPSAQGGMSPQAPIQAPTYPPMPTYNPNPNLLQAQNPNYPKKIDTLVVDKVEIAGLNKSEKMDPKFERDEVLTPTNRPNDSIIPNAPMLTESNVIELNAVGMGIPPENTISPGQAMALAKRAAIIDAYRQIGEKMYGIRLNAQDTVKDMVVQNSSVKTKVEALIRNAEISESVWKDGMMQVSMQLKLDGRVWHRVLMGNK